MMGTLADDHLSSWPEINDWKDKFSHLSSHAVALHLITLSSFSQTMATQAIIMSHARPGPGRAGQPVTVQTNHYEIQGLEGLEVHQYDVALVPDVPPPVRRRLYEQLLKCVDSDMAGIRPVYDGRQNMFTSKELPFISRLFEVCFERGLS
jgi:hypothetical protein